MKAYTNKQCPQCQQNVSVHVRTKPENVKKFCMTCKTV